MRVVVIGAGPAGVMAAWRAAELGASTTLLARHDFGGMAANDGPVPVRTLAHAVRLIREARQLGSYGITASEPVLDYPRLLARFSDSDTVEALQASGQDLPATAEQLAREVTLFGTYDEGPAPVDAWVAAGADSVALVLPPGRPEDELAELLDVMAR